MVIRLLDAFFELKKYVVLDNYFHFKFLSRRERILKLIFKYICVRDCYEFDKETFFGPNKHDSKQRCQKRLNHFGHL